MPEKALVMLKPKGVPLEDRLVEMLKPCGEITYRKLWKKAPMDRITTLYYEHRGKWFYEPHLKVFEGNPIITFVVENTFGIYPFIGELRKRIGATNCADAAPGTFRYLVWSEVYKKNHKFGDSRFLQDKKISPDNGVHCSDSPLNGEIEDEAMHRENFVALQSKVVGGIYPWIIRHIRDDSIKKRLLLHGIKRYEEVSKVKTQGVLPLTPEGGNVSYWATGNRIFDPQEDSPLYHYAHSFSKDQQRRYHMVLAVSSYDLIKRSGIRIDDFDPGTEIKAYDRIPPDLINLIEIELNYKRGLFGKDPRKVGQFGEREILKQLYELVSKPFEPGRSYRKFDVEF